MCIRLASRRLAIASLVAATLTAAPQRSTGSGLDPGRSHPGFATYEGTRPGATGPRRFQIACWYPAVSASPERNPMTIAQYVAASGGDDPAAEQRDAVAAYMRAFLAAYLKQDAGARALFDASGPRWLTTRRLPARALR
jgi:hypothetical protein